jgi:hypothetical protein
VRSLLTCYKSKKSLFEDYGLLGCHAVAFWDVMLCSFKDSYLQATCKETAEDPNLLVHGCENVKSRIPM